MYCQRAGSADAGGGGAAVVVVAVDKWGSLLATPDSSFAILVIRCDVAGLRQLACFLWETQVHEQNLLI